MTIIINPLTHVVPLEDGDVIVTGQLISDMSTGQPPFIIFSSTPVDNLSINGTAANLFGGLLGSIPYQSNINTTSLISPNTTATKKFLTQTGNGSISASPVWSAIEALDINNLKFTSGGTNSEDINTLDAYVEGSISTPTITFGGGNTGIIYTSRSGAYTRIGNVVTLSFFILLSSKGSSTGALVIDALPIASNASVKSILSLDITAVAATIGDSHLTAFIEVNATTITLYKMVSGTRVQLTDADITNTTLITLSGSYFV